MSAPLRSAGWSVQPSFVPNGAVTPVTLLLDDQALTQLAGEPAVAWQTPWDELSNLQVVRFARGMALFATVAGVRYSWRNPSRADFDALRTHVLSHGGSVARHRRRAGIYSVAVVVLIAALAGVFGSWLYRDSTSSEVITDTRDVNLTLRDLPTGWFASPAPNASLLSDLFPPAGQVQRPSATPTTLPKKNSIWAKVSTVFEQCMGVSARHDRVYGPAGQQPEYQASSRIFDSPSFGGIEVVSTTQYYLTTTMVHRDTHEMSLPRFGSCFATSNVALVRAVYRATVPTTDIGTTYQPTTFLHGWTRGGEAILTMPSVAERPHLIVVMLTNGHYEVTLGVLTNQWPKAQPFVSNLTSTLLSRMVSPTSKPV